MSNEAEIAQAVRQFVGDNFLFRAGAGSLSDTDSLLEGGLIDSMGVLELVTFLEGKFGIRVADDEVIPQNLDTVARIAAFAHRKLRPAGQLAGVGHAG